MKRISLFAAAVISALVFAYAADDASVIVNPLSGDAHAEALTLVSRMEMTDGTLRIVAKADGATLYSLPISRCRSVVFGKAESSALNDAIADAAAEVSITPEPAAHAVRVSGLDEGQPVNVYSLTGAKVLTGAAPVVSLTGLQRGIYIVVAGPAAAKVIVK